MRVREHRWLLVVTAALVAALVAPSCRPTATAPGGSDTTATSTTAARPRSWQLSAGSEHRVVVDDGVELLVEPGDLSTTTKVTMTRRTAPAERPWFGATRPPIALTIEPAPTAPLTLRSRLADDAPATFHPTVVMQHGERWTPALGTLDTDGRAVQVDLGRSTVIWPGWTTIDVQAAHLRAWFAPDETAEATATAACQDPLPTWLAVQHTEPRSLHACPRVTVDPVSGAELVDVTLTNTFGVTLQLSVVWSTAIGGPFTVVTNADWLGPPYRSVFPFPAAPVVDDARLHELVPIPAGGSVRVVVSRPAAEVGRLELHVGAQFTEAALYAHLVDRAVRDLWGDPDPVIVAGVLAQLDRCGDASGIGFESRFAVDVAASIEARATTTLGPCLVDLAGDPAAVLETVATVLAAAPNGAADVRDTVAGAVQATTAVLGEILGPRGPMVWTPALDALSRLQPSWSSAFFTLDPPLAPPADPTLPLVIGGLGLGQLVLWMSEADARATGFVTGPVTSSCPFGPIPTATIVDPATGDPLGIATFTAMSGGVLRAVTITVSAVPTAEGAAVGMSRDEVARIHPDLRTIEFVAPAAVAASGGDTVMFSFHPESGNVHAIHAGRPGICD